MNLLTLTAGYLRARALNTTLQVVLLAPGGTVLSRRNLQVWHE